MENKRRITRLWIIIHFWETAHLPLPKLNELPEVRFEFPFNLTDDHDKQNKGLFYLANRGAYLNLGTQLVVQNKDFGAVSQTELTRV